ncbi:hypothetical protein V5799_027819 [Amblyomma americanum]|uniref:Very-long-chain (3R)-3-hydroxyacyl-CoA dehydratase n=1 Tax=Amblyomma americanum TaxID=6943 RepID=A0AAQ4DEM0_AMBAM
MVSAFEIRECDTPFNLCEAIRYSFFLVLYPTGVSGEIVSMVAALPYIRQRGLFTFPLPNWLNFSFDYHTFVILVIASYVPFFPQLFGHLLKQRKRFLAPADDSKRK